MEVAISESVPIATGRNERVTRMLRQAWQRGEIQFLEVLLVGVQELSLTLLYKICIHKVCIHTVSSIDSGSITT